MNKTKVYKWLRFLVSCAVAGFLSGIMFRFCFWVNHCEADEGHVKMLLHGATTISEKSNWGLAGWMVAVDFEKVLGVAGARFNSKDFWVEGMAGALVSDKVIDPAIDFRASFTEWDPICLWGEVTYFPKSDGWYQYFEVNYKVKPWLLAGAETENNFFDDTPNNLSIGPHFIFLYKQLCLVFAYQIHSVGENQLWFRAVVHFQ